MVDSGKEVTYKTFSSHVKDWPQFCIDMGYALSKRDGLTMKNDYHVQYFKGRYRGARCYYMVHSAIEWVFTIQEERHPLKLPQSKYMVRPFGIEKTA